MYPDAAEPSPKVTLPCRHLEAALSSLGERDEQRYATRQRSMDRSG